MRGCVCSVCSVSPHLSLHCDDGEVTSPGLLLVALSPFLRSCVEEQEVELVLLPSVSTQYAVLLLDLIQFGEVTLTKCQVSPVLHIMKLLGLQIPGLVLEAVMEENQKEEVRGVREKDSWQENICFSAEYFPLCSLPHQTSDQSTSAEGLSHQFSTPVSAVSGVSQTPGNQPSYFRDVSLVQPCLLSPVPDVPIPSLNSPIATNSLTASEIAATNMVSLCEGKLQDCSKGVVGVSHGIRTCISHSMEGVTDNQVFKVRPRPMKHVNYKCSLCEQQFNKKTPLLIHIRNIHKEEKICKRKRRHQCSQCSKAFFSNSQLLEHVGRHEEKPGYCCDHCGKAFYRKDCLAVHTKSIHIGVKDFVCTICAKKFTDRYKLKRHMKTHVSKLSKRRVSVLSLLKLDFVTAKSDVSSHAECQD